MGETDNKIPEKYLNKINELNLEKVSPREYEDKGDYVIITIDGGLNGSCDWRLYLPQITKIVQEFNAWVIDLIMTASDDVWTLRIGIDK